MKSTSLVAASLCAVLLFTGCAPNAEYLTVAKVAEVSEALPCKMPVEMSVEGEISFAVCSGDTTSTRWIIAMHENPASNWASVQICKFQRFPSQTQLLGPNSYLMVFMPDLIQNEEVEDVWRVIGGNIRSTFEVCGVVDWSSQ